MVAIKVIEHSEEDSSKVDGLREALLCSNIQHPNVVGMHPFMVPTRAAINCPHSHKHEYTSLCMRALAPGSCSWGACMCSRKVMGSMMHSTDLSRFSACSQSLHKEAGN